MEIKSRVFTGLSLPPKMLTTMEALLEELEPLARIRWSRSFNLHITTKFIGSFDFHRIPYLCRYLHSQEPPGGFSIVVKGLERCWRPGGSTVISAHVEACEGLTELSCRMDEQLQSFGVKPDQGEYRPHITLGRIPGANPWPLLGQKLEEYALRPFGSFEVKEYHLYESLPSGLYRPITTVPLADVSSTL